MKQYILLLVLMVMGAGIHAYAEDVNPVKEGNVGSPDKPGGLSIQLCKSEKKEFYIRYSS